MCAAACAKVCETFKYLHQVSTSLLYAPNSVNTLFLSGLTLLYCSSRLSALASPRPSRFTTAIYACNTMLYVMAERWKPAHRYRNAFERVKEVMFDTAAQSPPTAADPAQLDHNPCNVTSAVDAFFTNIQKVDTLLESVLDSRGMHHGWSDLDGSGLDAEAWIEHLGQLSAAGHDGPGWDDPVTLLSA